MSPVSLRHEPYRETLLQQFLDRNGIPSARIEAKLQERLLGRTPSRKQLARWRLGRVDVRREDMVRILWAVRAASGNPRVRMEEIFDLDPDNENNW